MESKEILKQLSTETWQRISFARQRTGFKIYETTITQNILYELTRNVDHFGYNILLYEAVSEAKNGNDIECFIEHPGGRYLCFPIQAKILYADDHYRKISHKAKGIRQVDHLLRYAREKSGYPLYFLYNWSTSSHYEHFAPENKHQIECFGITFASAIFLKNTYLSNC